MLHYFNSKGRIINYLFFGFLIFCIYLPSQTSVYLSGIPITNSYSTIISIIFLAFIIFNLYIIKNLFIRLIICILLISKLSLLFFPLPGVELKQYFSNNDYLENKFIRTYDSFWNSNTSYIQTRQFNKKKNFPIDWTVHSEINFYDKDKRYFKNFEEYIGLDLIYDINFSLYIPDDSKFKILTEGNKEKNIFFQKFGTNKKNIFLLNNEYLLEKGFYDFSGKISFVGSQWSLKYLNEVQNKYESAFKNYLIYQSNNNFENFNTKFLFIKNISKIIDLMLIILLLLSLFIFIRKNIYYLNSYHSILFIIFPTIIYFILKNFTDKFDLYGSFPVSISFVYSIICIYFFRKKISFSSSNINFYYFIIIFPLLCLFYILKFKYELESVSWWDYGDDWTAFQTFARAIVVDKEWLNAGEGIIYFRPGIRYIFALIHIFYGFSGFAQKLIEPILIFSGCYLFILILLKFNVLPIISLLSSILLISIFLGENYRWNISRGITEYYSFFFIILNCYLIIKLDIKKNIYFFVMSFFGIINIWLREEHIILIFLSIYLSMINNQHKDNLPFFSSITKYTYINLYRILLFGFILSLGLFTLWLRNFYIGGSFGLDHPSLSSITNNTNSDHKTDLFFNFYMLFTASLWPNFPRITTIFLFGTFIISVLRLLNLRIFMPIHPSIIMLIAGCLIPGLLMPLTGYYPRYTIKYLPFCILLFSVLINKKFILKKL